MSDATNGAGGRNLVTVPDPPKDGSGSQTGEAPESVRKTRKAVGGTFQVVAQATNNSLAVSANKLLKKRLLEASRRATRTAAGTIQFTVGCSAGFVVSTSITTILLAYVPTVTITILAFFILVSMILGGVAFARFNLLRLRDYLSPADWVALDRAQDLHDAQNERLDKMELQMRQLGATETEIRERILPQRFAADDQLNQALTRALGDKPDHPSISDKDPEGSTIAPPNQGAGFAAR